MKAFMDDDFLLSTQTAKTLYHNYAKPMPIIDYHCHLSPKEIAEDKVFYNLTELTLMGDHYKWRLMSFTGANEINVKGNGTPKDKFITYAKALSGAIGNPLYHWTHLELRRLFGIYTPLTEESAPKIYDETERMMADGSYSAKKLIKKFNVTALCTTDDPTDDLSYHKIIAQDKEFFVKVLPAFRPDKAINIETKGFKEYIEKLKSVSGEDIVCPMCVLRALKKRAMYFNELGCKISDHSFYPVPKGDCDIALAKAAFQKTMAGETPTTDEIYAYKLFILKGLGKIYHELDWTQQYHMNALRNVNDLAFETFGPDTGFDSMADDIVANDVANLLNLQAKENALPRTILYTLNPGAYEALTSVAGSFYKEGVKGNVQLGAAWWYMDSLEGMKKQLTCYANTNALSCFVGMLTDSRSFASYPRHEYFRRILCALLGEWVEQGMYPNDMGALSKIVEDISYNNTKEFMKL